MPSLPTSDGTDLDTYRKLRVSVAYGVASYDIEIRRLIDRLAEARAEKSRQERELALIDRKITELTKTKLRSTEDDTHIDGN